MIKINKNHLIQLVIIIICVWLVFSLVLSKIPIVFNILSKSFDIYSTLSARLTSPPEETDNITIIAIDDETQKKMDLQWPWKRTFFVPIIEKLEQYNPAIIYLDFLFQGITLDDETTDIIFAQCVKTGKNIFVPYILTADSEALFPYSMLKQSSAGIGYKNKPKDPDGIIRRLNPASDKYNSIELVIAKHFVKDFPSEADIGTINGSTYIRCTIPPENFAVYNLIDLFNDKIPKDALTDKIVLLSATGDFFQNNVNTPLGYIKDVFLTANILTMYLKNDYVYAVNSTVYNTVLILLLVIFSIAILRLSSLKGFVFFILLLFFVLISGYLLFQNGFYFSFLDAYLVLICAYIVIGFFKHIILLEEKINALNKANIEIQRTQKELLRKEQLATIGGLTSQILHEFGNPMDNLKSCLGMMKTEIDKDSKLKRFIDISYSEVTRMSEISKQLKSSYTPHIINPVRSHINKIILEVLDAARYKIKDKHIELKTNLDKTLNEISISREKIKQAFYNIILNAIDAIQHGGTIEVITRKGINCQEIIFQDNGTGIPEEEIPNLFNAFYTTKLPGEGSGLGLFLTYEIIKAHKGEISVRSTIGKGTSFTVKLPI